MVGGALVRWTGRWYGGQSAGEVGAALVCHLCDPLAEEESWVGEQRGVVGVRHRALQQDLRLAPLLLDQLHHELLTPPNNVIVAKWLLSSCPSL